jgi:hypothetical protein
LFASSYFLLDYAENFSYEEMTEENDYYNQEYISY